MVLIISIFLLILQLLLENLEGVLAQAGMDTLLFFVFLEWDS